MPVIEQLLRKWNRCGGPIGYLVDLNGLIENKSRMEKLELKRQAVLTPPIALGIKADVPVLIVVELQKSLGDLGFRGFVRL